jgi:hypothetical protein
MANIDYSQEAMGPTLSGIITVGSVAGYDNGKNFSLSQAQEAIDKINKKLDSSIFTSIPCMIHEAHLVGRAGGSDYSEKLYKMTFAHSPRLNPISQNTFFETLCEYGFRLGRELEQQRVYVDFNDQTLVFRQTGDRSGHINNLESEAMKYLKKGRPEWDAPHTIETVNWMNRLVDAEGGNRKLLTSTMWLHDIGYSGMFDDRECNYDSISSAKAEHMLRGSEIAKDILTKLEYQPNEIVRISELVSIHDTPKLLESPYEIMVMEADTLGQVSQFHISPFSAKEDNTKFINYIKNLRLPIFKTVAGKQFLGELLNKEKGFI